MIDGSSNKIRLLEQSPAVEGQFSHFVESTDWQAVTQSHQEKTEQDVLRALSKDKLDVDDFAALICWKWSRKANDLPCSVLAIL